ncbi:MAG: toll/interleukin-1 receptor domain-containing protein [Planctomycetaceae bacterium]|nr:toll/interleukin-1 receptor domain-containing protein [Planctomycetaceae bacterium]
MSRRTSPTSRSNPGPVKLFVSYSHENSAWFGKLRPLLKFRNPDTNVAHVWHDQKLEAGHRWQNEIQAALKQMDVFVCLVSYEFLASDYIMNVELQEALRREKKDEVAIVPILLYPVNLV